MRLPAFAAIAAIVILSCSTIATATEQPKLEGPGRSVKPAGSYEVAQACGWYAIFECARSRRVEGPGRLIWTSDFPNFSPGWWCRAMGPFRSQGEAARRARSYGGYAKAAC